VRTPFGDVGPLALRYSHEAADPLALWVQPYSGLPTRTDPRATFYAARALGVRRLVAWDTGIAVNPSLQRGQLAIATDLIDWTRHQPDTFAASPGLEELPIVEEPAPGPFCVESVNLLHDAYPAAAPVVVVGTDGPRRETAAEARMFRSWGADVICTNVAPEAFLAREIGLCFSTLVTVGGYSADQMRRPIEGEVRHGLGSTMSQLPALLRRLNRPPSCLCRP